MSVNERTPDADFFTVICLQSLQTAEPGVQLQLISKVAHQASFPHFCLICEPFIRFTVETRRQFVKITDWSWHILTFYNIWHVR